MEAGTLTPTEVAVYSTFLVISLLLGTFGNAVVCLAVYFSGTLRQQVCNMFVVNLAMTDLITVLFIAPICVINVIKGRWIWGAQFCNSQAFAYYTLGIVALLSIALVSLDRYIAIVHPLLYKTKMTVARARYMLLSAWLWSFAFTLPCIFFGWFKYASTESMCTINFAGTGDTWKTRVTVYGVITITLCVALPSLVMFYSYIKILTIVNHHLRRVFTTSSNESQRSLSVRLHGQFASVTSPEYRGFRTIGLVILIFLVSWLPFSVTKLIKALKWDHEAVPATYDTFATVSTFFSAAFNPVAYGLFRKDFRKAIKNLILQVFGSCRRYDIAVASIKMRSLQKKRNRCSNTKTSVSNRQRKQEIIEERQNK